VFSYLRTHLELDIAAAHIVISGSQVVLCRGDELIDAVRKGQGVLNVLPLAGVKGEIDAAIVELRPAKAGPVAEPARRAARS
jgi:hypothetical protein